MLLDFREEDYRNGNFMVNLQEYHKDVANTVCQLTTKIILNSLHLFAMYLPRQKIKSVL